MFLLKIVSQNISFNVTLLLNHLLSFDLGLPKDHPCVWPFKKYELTNWRHDVASPERKVKWRQKEADTRNKICSHFILNMLCSK